jgi:hypothetical protein
MVSIRNGLIAGIEAGKFELRLLAGGCFQPGVKGFAVNVSQWHRATADLRPLVENDKTLVKDTNEKIL